MNETYNIIFKSLKDSGFVAPCASDMTGYLISCLSRPNPASSIRDIDDVIKALETYKATLKP
jgi:hypothetical protein